MIKLKLIEEVFDSVLLAGEKKTLVFKTEEALETTRVQLNQERRKCYYRGIDDADKIKITIIRKKKLLLLSKEEVIVYSPRRPDTKPFKVIEEENSNAKDNIPAPL